MINKIAHLADIHIRKTPNRNIEYEQVFNKLYNSLSIEKPDRIVIVGDLVHDYLDLQGEQLILVSSFLNNLSKICPVVITRGNHDCRKKNIKRIDSIKAIVDTIKNPNIKYYDNTGVYFDDNVVWMVWHYGEKKNNPWRTKDGKDLKNSVDNQKHTTIDLYHDPVNGSKSVTGIEFKSKTYYKLSDFKGDLSMFGDIHKMQYLDKNKTKAYSGTLIAQDFSEGDDEFHGYLLWDVKNKESKKISIDNNYSFKNIRVTPYTDFKDIDINIDNPTNYMKVRIIWGCLPETRNPENEKIIKHYLKTKYDGIISISNKNEFLEKDEVVVDNTLIENITDIGVQQEIFSDYLDKIGVNESIISDIIELDNEITNSIELKNDGGIEWSVVKFGGINFMSYEKLDIDWKDMDGLFQIIGQNTAGKTTIMKLLSYVFFSKTLETESRMKHGDQRFVNNRNNAKYCEGYVILEANNEFFGVRRRTDINYNKDGEINKVPTSLKYYKLESYDDDMIDSVNSIDVLDEDLKFKTQKRIDEIVGSYDNFMRIVMTTSDTLNKILSNDMSTFIDSLLFDSGLDVFDKKLEGLKDYQKKINEKPKYTCDVPTTEEKINMLLNDIQEIENGINDLETVIIPNLNDRLNKGRDYVEDLMKKIFTIDEDITNLDVESTKENIIIHNKRMDELDKRREFIENQIKTLKNTYNEEKLNNLLEQKETHKTEEYKLKMDIKTIERNISDEQHKIEIINGRIFTLKRDGNNLKTEIVKLRNSKKCDQCGQYIDKKEHQEHINNKVKEKEGEMFEIADKINQLKNDEIKKHDGTILEYKNNIEKINNEINKHSIEMENVLNEIGSLTNDKNDFEKRKVLINELHQIPDKIENEKLKRDLLKTKIDSYENNLKQIKENESINIKIIKSKEKISEIEIEIYDKKEEILLKKTSIGQKQLLIHEKKELIDRYQQQVYRDKIMSLYKKCVHRDGVPKQILITHIIPKINLTLEKILSVAPFKVWLDSFDLRPKLYYYDRPDSIIDCISASGKERTFSSVVLKFALNQINIKSKPRIFLLDEVMGKLDEESVEEFVEILKLIKQSMKKVLVIEQRVNIEPDYIINVDLNDDGISNLNVN